MDFESTVKGMTAPRFKGDGGTCRLRQEGDGEGCNIPRLARWVISFHSESFLGEHPNMKSLIRAMLFLAAAVTANAQGYVEAMLNYTGTTPSGGTPVYTSIYLCVHQRAGWLDVSADDRH